ncbi:MAG: type II toxin-antitoxin system VapC family toxin [SAR202 cluster bacterium]|nr:type II toxin-antitoxin system VapC family toxin [SAR202 cluster bacterium]
MTDRVVDAPVIAAITFAEPEIDEADRLIGGATLFAPELLPYELANICWKKTRLHPELAGIFVPAIETMLDARVLLVAAPPAEIIALALETGLTAYDASYLSIAIALRAPLVTFDEQLRRAAQAQGLLAV